MSRHRSRHTVEMDTGKDGSEMTKKFTLEWIQNEINYYNEMCISVSYFDYLDVLKRLQTLTSYVAELEHECSVMNSELNETEIAIREGSRILQLSASRDAWKKLAEELGKNYDYGVCIHCDHALPDMPRDEENGIGGHSPDCPIEQLRELKEGEG